MTGNNNSNIHRGQVYKIYKYSTEKVFSWALQQHREVNKKKGKKKKGQGKGGGRKNHQKDKKLLSSLSLRAKIETLLSLCVGNRSNNETKENDAPADTTTTTTTTATRIMPREILGYLKDAIRLREKMSTLYNKLSMASEDDLGGHQWLIDQLKQALRGQESLLLLHQSNEEESQRELSGKFQVLSSLNKQEKDEEKKEETTSDTTTSCNNNTKLLRELKAQAKERIKVSEHLLKQEEKSFAIACAVMDIINVRRDMKRAWIDWAQREWTVQDEDDDEDSDDEDDEDDDNEEDDEGSSSDDDSFSSSSSSEDSNDDEGSSDDDSSSSSSSSKDNNDEDDCSGEYQQRNHFGIPKDNLHEAQELISTSMFCNVAIRMVEKLDNETLLTFEEDLMEVILRSEASADSIVESKEKDERDDNTLSSIKKIHNVLSENYELIFEQQYETVMEDISIPTTTGPIEEALRNRDITSFAKYFITDYFPLWRARLLENYSCWGYVERKRLLPFAMQILVSFDAATVQMTKSPLFGGKVQKMVSTVLCTIFNENVYENMHGWMEGEGNNIGDPMFGKNTRHIPLGQFDIATGYVNEVLPKTVLMPHQNGDFLFRCLQLHLQASLFLVQLCKNKLLHVLHIYHMLRNEGYLGRILPIEKTLVSVFSKEVFFRAGLPQRGEYTKSLQICYGYSPVNATRDKRCRKKKGGEPLIRKNKMSTNSKTNIACGEGGRCDTSMAVFGVSRLVQLAKLEIVPFQDRTSLFAMIRDIVATELPNLYMVPLHNVSMYLMYLQETIWVGEISANENDERTQIMALMDDLDDLFGNACGYVPPIPLRKIALWATTLGDHRGEQPGWHNFIKRREEVLKALAETFSNCFHVDDVESSRSMNFQFNDEPAKIEDLSCLSPS